MAKDSTQVRLGSGDLYINNVDVGFLSGEVLFTYSRHGMALPAAGSGSTDLVALATASLRATEGQFSASNLRLALGLAGSAGNSVGSLSYNPASVSIADAQSWQGLRIGREQVGDTVAIRFEHEKEDGKRIVVVLYTAFSLCDLKLPFGDEHVTIYDVEFLGLPDETRPAGDQVGIILEEI